MTDQTEDLELFDDAKEDFPGKEDLKDRLVAIWVTGKHGKRKASAPGSKPYDWYETVTLVLDDGPAWDGFKIVDDEKVEMLVPSVAAEGPQRLDDFQFTQGGLTSRLSSRVALTGTVAVVNGDPVLDKPKTWKPMLGRINSKKNKQAGFSASWSIASPTDEDKVIARKHAALIREISQQLEAAANAPASDEDAFE